MGLGSSRCAARQESDGQESERPSSKASESSVSENSIFVGGEVEQVPVVHTFAGSSSGTGESHGESRQKIRQEVRVAGEIQERRVHPPPRILSRTRQVNMNPLTRFHLRDNGRLSEPRHGQHNVEEMQARLRRHTGLAPSPDVVEPESSSAFMDSVPRIRQRGAEIPSHTRINTSATNDTSIGYNNTPVQAREPSLRRGRTGSVGPFEEVERYSIRDLVRSTRSVQRIASGPFYYSDLPGGGISRGEATGMEARRNGGRRFWDALTHAASHRRLSNHQDFWEDAEPLLPYNGRPAMSNTRVEASDLSHEEREGHYYQRNRSLNLEERRRRFRSQVWALQRLSTRFEGVPGHARPCAPGVRHESVGHSHESARAPEETNTRASISRIIMLAEALFQVLDEIHRQPLALSRSAGLSLGSLPAPDDVVESMPVRIFQRADTLENKEEAALQCHICLVEYEGGDQMRVLPCSHEYHMACIDKWLREVHRVCPLCRGDVCELRTAEDST